MSIRVPVCMFFFLSNEKGREMGRKGTIQGARQEDTHCALNEGRGRDELFLNVCPSTRKTLSEVSLH